MFQGTGLQGADDIQPVATGAPSRPACRFARWRHHLYQEAGSTARHGQGTGVAGIDITAAGHFQQGGTVQVDVGGLHGSAVYAPPASGGLKVNPREGQGGIAVDRHRRDCWPDRRHGLGADIENAVRIRGSQRVIDWNEPDGCQHTGAADMAGKQAVTQDRQPVAAQRATLPAPDRLVMRWSPLSRLRVPVWSLRAVDGYASPFGQNVCTVQCHGCPLGR